MNIHEYQAKALLERHGVPVPRGRVVRAAADVPAAVAELGPTVVVKAQIHAGGRGKGTFRDAETGKAIARPDGKGDLGGVFVARGADAAAEIVRRMLGNVLVTRQTGAEGRCVETVLVSEGIDIAREFYLALLVDRGLERLAFIASREGGTEIEEVASTRPAAIVRVPIDPRVGFSPWIGRKIAADLGLKPPLVVAASKLVGSLHQAFVGLDASLVEVNPLVETSDGRLLALDAKMSFDDSALWRQPEVRELRDTAEEAPLEVEASRHGLNYVKLDGNIGCMVNGAGLAMATMDIIQHHGGAPANFLDVGGGATAEMVTNGFRILLSDRGVRAVLINIFGGIMRCDIVAEGVVAAARQAQVAVPVVVRLEGTNVERGRAILLESGLRFEVADGMADAARRAVAAAGGH